MTALGQERLLREMAFRCPDCRSALVSLDGSLSCTNCAFRCRVIDDIVSFAPEGNEWNEMFESKASSGYGDTSAGNAYKFPMMFELMVAAFKRVCPELKTESLLLDVGCGNGLFWESTFASHKTIGVDYSMNMCRLAAKRGMTVVHAQGGSLPFGDRQFDLVYSAEVLQYIKDLPAFFAELSRVCIQGGTVVVSSPNRKSLLRRVNEVIHPRNSDWDHPAIKRTLRETVDAVKGSGLRFQSVCWSHPPARYLHRSHSASYLGQPLAANFVVSFIKN